MHFFKIPLHNYQCSLWGFAERGLSGYTFFMGKRSKIMEEKRRIMIEESRQRTPDQRLEICAVLSRAICEVHRAGEAYRASLQKPSS